MKRLGVFVIFEDELQPNTDVAMCLEILKLLQSYGENIALLFSFGEIELRGLELYSKGLGIADAMHVAYAEACGAEFITCDDDLLRKCRRNNVRIWYGTPVDFGKKEGLL
jgi:predicted nucleic acid-binding protein